MTTVDVLSWLQTWFVKQCDGDWEEEYGVKIETLANPGWAVDIDLTGTDVQNADVPLVKEMRSEDDWFTYKIDKRRFIGNCGPENLHDVLEGFRNIVLKQQMDARQD